MGADTIRAHLPPRRASARGDRRELQATLLERFALALVGKQRRWSVVGPTSRSLHPRLDELVDAWGGLVGATAVGERIRARMDRLGELDAASQDTPIAIARERERQLWIVRDQPPRPEQNLDRCATVRLPHRSSSAWSCPSCSDTVSCRLSP